jgi:hypothetical protein
MLSFSLAAVLLSGCQSASRPSGSSSASSSAPPHQEASMTGSSEPAPAPAEPPQSFPSRRHHRAAPEHPRTTGPGAEAPTNGRAPADSNNEYALGDQVEAWKSQLKNGAVEYYVPPAMVAQVPSAVTVDVHGYQDAQTHSLPEATGADTVKVSSRMKVELLAPGNPGEFAITPQSGDAIQFIPNDGHATWIWNVTPANAAKNQQLQIRVSLVYQRDGNDLDQILEEKNYTVNVDVQALAVTLRQSFWKDPIAWFKYMLPGGAGWGALAALAGSLGGLTWWKRKKKKTPAPKKAAG